MSDELLKLTRYVNIVRWRKSFKVPSLIFNN